MVLGKQSTDSLCGCHECLPGYVLLFYLPTLPAGDAGLRKHFENTISSAGGSMRSVKVAVRKGPDGKPLSMGFGFVECSSEDIAKAVLQQLQVSHRHSQCSATSQAYILSLYLPFELVTHCCLVQCV